MKRFFTLLGLALFVTGGSLFAETATLIDFAKLIGEGENNLHAPTVIDYSRQAGSSFTQDDKNAMKISLAIPSWEVELTSSARTPMNQRNSQIRPAEVRSGAARYEGQTVMGVRVFFPEFNINSWAMIKPPFEIPAYSTLEGDDQATPGGQFEGGYGIVKNVGIIKAIQVEVLGRNYPNGLSVVLEDQNGVEKQIFMGYLNFDGWKSLQWNNPNYLTEVRHRELFISPLYPNSSPYIKFKGLIVHRDAAQRGGDFISYFKDVKMIYDLAELELNQDVDDEGTWGILQAREESRRNFELSRLGNLQVLRTLETRKMATEQGFADPE